MTRNCPNCGKAFEITIFTTGKIYCSEDCKRELNRERNRELQRKRLKKKKGS